MGYEKQLGLLIDSGISKETENLPGFTLFRFELLYKMSFPGVVHPFISQALNWYLSAYSISGVALTADMAFPFASPQGALLLLFLVISAVLFLIYLLLFVPVMMVLEKCNRMHAVKQALRPWLKFSLVI